MPYVNQRWLGGLLTNFQTISARIDRLHELTALKDEGQLDLLPTKERMSMEAELEKLEYNLGGVRDMKRLPQAALIIDLKTEAIAVAEASACEIPILGLVDSNVDPMGVSFPIPGNDDSMRSCELVISTIGEAVEESANAYRETRGQAPRRGGGAPPRRGGGEAQARGGGAGAQGGRGGRQAAEAAEAEQAAQPTPSRPARRRAPGAPAADEPPGPQARRRLRGAA